MQMKSQCVKLWMRKSGKVCRRQSNWLTLVLNLTTKTSTRRQSRVKLRHRNKKLSRMLTSAIELQKSNQCMTSRAIPLKSLTLNDSLWINARKYWWRRTKQCLASPSMACTAKLCLTSFIKAIRMLAWSRSPPTQAKIFLLWMSSLRLRSSGGKTRKAMIRLLETLAAVTWIETRSTMLSLTSTTRTS